MSDAFLPEGGRGAAPHDDPLEREDVDLTDESGDDELSVDVSRGIPDQDDTADGEAPARAAAFRTPTGGSVDPADD